MPATFDAKSVGVTYLGTNTTTLTLAAGTTNNITVGSGTTRAAVFFIGIGNSSPPTVSSVTWDNGGTNQAASFINGTTRGVCRSELWGLVAPASGNLGLKVVLSGTAQDIYAAAVSFTGVNQTGGATTFANGTTGSGTAGISLAVTSNTNNQVVATMTASATNISTMSGTNVYLTNVGLNDGSAASYTTGAATVTVTSTPNNTWAMAAANVVAAAAAATQVPFQPYFQQILAS